MKKLILPVFMFLAACNSDSTEPSESLDKGVASVNVVCSDPETPAPPGAWVCPSTTTVECAGPGGTEVGTLYTSSASCDGATVTASAQGPFALGTHSVTVTLTPAQGEAEVCQATVQVVDTKPPVLTPRTSYLWPPNHKMHTLTPSDCAAVADVCDPSVRLFFTYATSDEPVNSTGDGNTEPDLVVGCSAVQVRSERKGNGNARIYTLGVRAVDASGNTADAACQVIVAHDQGGKVPVDSGPAYRVDGPACP